MVGPSRALTAPLPAAAAAAAAVQSTSRTQRCPIGQLPPVRKLLLAAAAACIAHDYHQTPASTHKAPLGTLARCRLDASEFASIQHSHSTTCHAKSPHACLGQVWLQTNSPLQRFRHHHRCHHHWRHRPIQHRHPRLRQRQPVHCHYNSYHDFARTAVFLDRAIKAEAEHGSDLVDEYQHEPCMNCRLSSSMCTRTSIHI